MNSSQLLEDLDQSQLAHKIDDLQKQIAEVTQLLGFLAGRSHNCRCQPFICEGRVRFLVTADELTTFIPRSTATLIEWANAGRIDSAGRLVARDEAALDEVVLVARALFGQGIVLYRDGWVDRFHANGLMGHSLATRKTLDFLGYLARSAFKFHRPIPIRFLILPSL